MSDSSGPVEDRGTKETHYRMDHVRRGVAAIINIEHFGNSTFGERKGSQNDVLSLRTAFRKLGFEVEIHCDLTRCQVERTLRELSERDHSDCDCLVVAYMSHGLQGQLRASDEIFDMQNLFAPFTGERCPTMVNKPKLFFIQACQGHDKQTGVYTQPEINETVGAFLGIDATKMIVIPSRADMLFAISTIPGFVSWRSPVSGAWYIQALCRWLNCAGFTMDLLTILTRVTREVAVDCTFHNPFNPSDPVCKQLPFFGSSLLRTLKFTKKIKTCRSSRKKSDAEEDEQSDDEDDLQDDSLDDGFSLTRLEEEQNEFGSSSVENRIEEKDFLKYQRFSRPNTSLQQKGEILERNFPLINTFKQYFSGEREKLETQSMLVEENLDEKSHVAEIVHILQSKPSLMTLNRKRRSGTDDAQSGSSNGSSSKRKKHS